MKEIARERGGECLSTHYKNAQTKLRFRCGECRHTWWATPASVRLGKWCKPCGHVRRANSTRSSLEKCQAMARERGGECLSKSYTNAHVTMRWRCHAGHQWPASANTVQRGHWCGKCANLANGERQRGSLDEYHEVAKRRGGRLLSTEFINANRCLSWECARGHHWRATGGSVKAGSWCRICKTHHNLSEQMCRAVFELAFGQRFPQAYPPWLRTTANRQLQLDGYCESLGLAFEHQGSQHEKETPHFHRDPSAKSGGNSGTKAKGKTCGRSGATPAANGLSAIKARDRRKRFLCRRHEVALVAIPTVQRLRDLDEIVTAVRQACIAAGVKLPRFKLSQLDLDACYIAPDEINRLREHAASRGGRCLSKQYLGTQRKHDWECAKGHRWSARWSHVKGNGNGDGKGEGKGGGKGGSWCQPCVREESLKRRYGDRANEFLKGVSAMARDRGGVCLAKVYVNSSTKMPFRCGQSHPVFQLTPNSLQQGKWCTICRRAEAGLRRRDSLLTFQLLARDRGGRCLSKTYGGSKVKLKYSCGEGHPPWKALPGSIKQGHWCPYCAGNQKV